MKRRQKRFVIKSTIQSLYHHMSVVSTDVPVHRHLVFNRINYPIHKLMICTPCHPTTNSSLLTPIIEPTILYCGQCRHDHVFAVMLINCHDLQGEAMPSLEVFCSIPKAPRRNLSGFPVLPLSFGDARLSHAFWVCLSFSLYRPTQCQ